MKSSPIIAALTLTAIILGVIILATPSRHADASMLYNDYDLTLMTASAGGDDALVVIDRGAQKMIVYTLANSKDLNVVAGCTLPHDAAHP